MNVLDLFSGGCGGWSLGLHRAGFRTVVPQITEAIGRAILAVEGVRR